MDVFKQTYSVNLQRCYGRSNCDRNRSGYWFACCSIVKFPAIESSSQQSRIIKVS